MFKTGLGALTCFISVFYHHHHHHQHHGCPTSLSFACILLLREGLSPTTLCPSLLGQPLILQGLESLSWPRPGRSPPFPAPRSPTPWETLRHSPYPLDVPELWAPCQQEWGLTRLWMLRSWLSAGFRAGTSWSLSWKSLPVHFEHFTIPHWVFFVCVHCFFWLCPVACEMWDLSSLIRNRTCTYLTNYFPPYTTPFYLPLATTDLCFVSEELSYLFL